ncbi:PREDICTED: filaggrin-2-like [Priapulus caudatus]|uniref:Filaggrin-2-like n=1 Tax=Priapulus caudatus TaxID=37621 RepID=A0ABM1DVT2_PRICU|nr:PREDICTED: filaggrin-2-like [Priapulus caudatus]
MRGRPGGRADRRGREITADKPEGETRHGVSRGPEREQEREPTISNEETVAGGEPNTSEAGETGLTAEEEARKKADDGAEEVSTTHEVPSRRVGRGRGGTGARGDGTGEQDAEGGRDDAGLGGLGAGRRTNQEGGRGRPEGETRTRAGCRARAAAAYDTQGGARRRATAGRSEGRQRWPDGADDGASTPSPLLRSGGRGHTSPPTGRRDLTGDSRRPDNERPDTNRDAERVCNRARQRDPSHGAHSQRAGAGRANRRGRAERATRAAGARRPQAGAGSRPSGRPRARRTVRGSPAAPTESGGRALQRRPPRAREGTSGERHGLQAGGPQARANCEGATAVQLKQQAAAAAAGSQPAWEQTGLREIGNLNDLHGASQHQWSEVIKFSRD